MSFHVDAVAGNVLTADAAEADGVVSARVRGTADAECRAELDTFVKALHQQAAQHGVQKVVVDFRELKFMNSSSFKLFVTWLAQVNELPANAKYRIHFLSNPNLHWQRRSLAALSCFAVDLVTIET